VFGIFERVTPLIEPLSLDEAFLDVTGSTTLFGPPVKIAALLRARIAKELDLPASAGIAEVKFVAKIASDLAKPNGQREVPAGTAREFLAPLPISRLWGVGPRTEEHLKRVGFQTIGDVAAKPLGELEGLRAALARRPAPADSAHRRLRAGSRPRRRPAGALRETRPFAHRQAQPGDRCDQLEVRQRCDRDGGPRRRAAGERRRRARPPGD